MCGKERACGIPMKHEALSRRCANANVAIASKRASVVARVNKCKEIARLRFASIACGRVNFAVTGRGAVHSWGANQAVRFAVRPGLGRTHHFRAYMSCFLRAAKHPVTCLCHKDLLLARSGGAPPSPVPTFSRLAAHVTSISVGAVSWKRSVCAVPPASARCVQPPGSDHAVALTAHGRVFTWGQRLGWSGANSLTLGSLSPSTRLEACTSFGLRCDRSKVG